MLRLRGAASPQPSLSNVNRDEAVPLMMYTDEDVQMMMISRHDEPVMCHAHNYTVGIELSH